MKQLILLFSIILTSFSSGLAQNNFGSLQGVVTDYKTKDSIAFVNVVLYKNDTVFVAGTRTDFNGKFKLNALQADKYKVVFQSVGYVKFVYEGVVVNPNKITFFKQN